MSASACRKLITNASYKIEKEALFILQKEIEGPLLRKKLKSMPEANMSPMNRKAPPRKVEQAFRAIIAKKVASLGRKYPGVTFNYDLQFAWANNAWTAKIVPKLSYEVKNFGGGTYVVCKGDTLSSIARNEYGSSEYWPQIAEANRGKVSKNGNLILVGTKLSLPVLPISIASCINDRVISGLPTGKSGGKTTAAEVCADPYKLGPHKKSGSISVKMRGANVKISYTVTIKAKATPICKLDGTKDAGSWTDMLTKHVLPRLVPIMPQLEFKPSAKNNVLVLQVKGVFGNLYGDRTKVGAALKLDLNTQRVIAQPEFSKKFLLKDFRFKNWKVDGECSISLKMHFEIDWRLLLAVTAVVAIALLWGPAILAALARLFGSLAELLKSLPWVLEWLKGLIPAGAAAGMMTFSFAQKEMPPAALKEI